MTQLESKLSNRRFIISRFPMENQRKLMKTKIFLNSNNMLTYYFDCTDLKIDFLCEDELLVAKEIRKIICFIEKTFEINVHTDANITLCLEKDENLISSFKNSYALLQKLKEQKNLNENLQFNEFCSFCDNTLSCKLRTYQYLSSFFLTIGQGGFDFSVPGSGKTIITYSAYNFLRYKGVCDSVLIIGPMNSYNAWQDEYVTCFGKLPDFISLANLTKNETASYLLSSINNHSEITFINIDKAWRLQRELIDFIKSKKALLIIDEAHKEKNPNAEITKAVLEIAKYARHRILLTGTPMPNGYEDLFSLVKIYEPYMKILPYSFDELKRMSKNGANEVQQKNIINSIKPIYSRVSKAHLLNTGELLPPNYVFIDCHLSNEQSQIYYFLQKMAFEISNDFESLLNVNLMKAIIIRKLQVSANPSLLSKSILSTLDEYKEECYRDLNNENFECDLLIKADEQIKKAIKNSSIVELIHKFENGYYDIPKNNVAVKLALKLVSEGKKVIIWDIFVQNMFSLKFLINKQSKQQVEIINGLVCGKERQDAINRFKYGKSSILIANPSTLAESISLHRACQNAIYVNRNFNAAQFIQSKDRIHRINMPLGTTATYYFVINKETVDEIINERLKVKEDRMLKVLDSDELVIGGEEIDNSSFMSMEDLVSSFKK